MNIDANKVINKLLERIAQLEKEKAIQAVLIEELQNGEIQKETTTTT